MFCSSCGARARETDRYCLKCGALINSAASPEPLEVEPTARTPTLGMRVGDFAVAHAKGLLILLGLAILLGIGALAAKDESTIAEDPSSPGYQFVRDLKAAGEIYEFKAIEPEAGYDTEYSLDDGDAYVRFNGEGMEYEVASYEEDLKAAIEAEAGDSGFGD